MFGSKNNIMLLLAIFGLSIASLAIADDFIVKNGQSDYVIVVSKNPSQPENTAASELQQCIEKMTGKKLSIVKSDSFTGKKMIAVGFNDKLPDDLSKKKFEQDGKLAPEEIIIASDGEILLLAGGQPRGTLYAVYEYLHRLGVRWYSPEFVKIPELSTIPLKKENYRYNPPVFSRTQVSGNAPDQIWTARNRLNSFVLWSPLEAKFGGGIGQGPDMHTLTRILPVSVLEKHPEWMAMVDGKREKPVTHTWGVCLSNPDLRKYIIERTMEWARKHPDRQCIWFGQNDGSDPCECDECKAFYAAHGGVPSSLIIKTANELADKFKKEFPDKFVKTLAYGWSLTPPANMNVRDNVIIMFCAAGEYDVPIRTDKSEFRQKMQAAITDWRKIAKNLEVYLYPFPVDSYWFVSPSILPACDNIKWAYENGVKNIYTQISGYAGLKGSSAVDLRSWLFARLSWDPSQDPLELIKDFCKGYYGPAWKTVYDAIISIHDGVLDEENNIREFHQHSIVPHDLDPVKIRKINIALEKAYNDLKDPVYKKHLSDFWTAYLWSDFWLGYTGLGKYNEKTGQWCVELEEADLRNKYARLIKKFMIQNGVTAMRENVSLNPHNLAIEKMGIDFPAVKICGDNASAVVVPGIAGHVESYIDKRLKDFMPFKPCWGFCKLEYPICGSTREFVNTDFVKEYRLVSHTDNSVVMNGRAWKTDITKKVGFYGNSLRVEILAKPNYSGKLKISPAVMLDLQDNTFGDYPTVYVENKSGKWSKNVLGKISNFWYQPGSIDISDCTGRVVIAAEKNSHGLLMTFDLKNITSLTYVYDRYDKYPDKLGRMIWLNPTAEFNAHVGQVYRVKVDWQILPDYKILLNGSL